MKKILIVLAVLILAGSMIFAATTGDSVGSTSGTSIAALKKPTQHVSLDLSTAESFALGFSTDSKHTASESAQLSETVLKLSETDRSKATNAESPLYVWWDITTSKGFTVTLEMTQALTSTSSSVSWTVNGEAGSGISDPVSTIALDSANTKSDEFINYTVAEGSPATIKHITGEQKLNISTGNLAGKPAESYSADLILSITQK